MTIKAKFSEEIPVREIYEMDEGKPIFYKGFRYGFENFHKNEKTMPDSDYQSWLKGRVHFFLMLLLMDNAEYDVTVGEHGLSLKKNLWRAVDVAIFKVANLAMSNHYSKNPPEVVFEIDLKGDFDTPTKARKDQNRKIKQLFEFGVKKIIWIYTDEKIINVITPKNNQSYNWNEDILVLEEYSINLQQLIEKYQKH